MRKIELLVILVLACTLLLTPELGGKEKDTFSISLVQRATVNRMRAREVIYERYTVKKGDYIWKLLRKRGLLEKEDLSELLTVLKKINPSLTNLDLIHPGETVLIPLNIIPVKGYGKVREVGEESALDVTSLEGMEFENYVVRPGDTLTKIVRNRFDIPPELFFENYLQLMQKLNPNLTNPDLIYPNQMIRLPIYSPEIIAMPIKAEVEGEEAKERSFVESPDTTQSRALKRDLKGIFNQMGQEWVDTGEQYIPLKSGGQVNLKAESFPVLNLTTGRRLIVDMKGDLPEDISRIIEADWEDYKVVHLATNDTLRTAVDKILTACNFHTLVRAGDYFKVRGEVDIAIAGDWAIIPQKGEGDIPDKIITLTFIGNRAEQTPRMVIEYLKKLGVTVIDYPDFIGLEDTREELPAVQRIVAPDNTDFPLPTVLLELVGQPFAKSVEMPLYRGEDPAFNLIIKTDLFFKRDGRDCIIETTGLSPQIVSLLIKHRIYVLSLSGERDPRRIAALLLDFLEVPFASKLHQFPVSARDRERSITISFSGISFADRDGNMVLATDRRIPNELMLFLNRSGYQVLDLTQF